VRWLPVVPDDELPPARPRTRPVGIRFDESTLRRIKVLAARRHKGYQTLLREFITETRTFRQSPVTPHSASRGDQHAPVRERRFVGARRASPSSTDQRWIVAETRAVANWRDVLPEVPGEAPGRGTPPPAGEAARRGRRGVGPRRGTPHPCGNVHLIRGRGKPRPYRDSIASSTSISPRARRSRRSTLEPVGGRSGATPIRASRASKRARAVG
jgi:hypothetical protein